MTGRDLTFEDEEPVISDESYKVYGKRGYNKVVLVMGQVCYAVNEYKFSLDNLGYNTKIVLKAPVGACSIAASREELQYDDKTNKFIAELLRVVLISLENNLEDYVGKGANILERAQRLDECSGLLHHFRSKYSSHFNTTDDAYTMRRITLMGGGTSLRIDDGYRVRGQKDCKYLFIEKDTSHPLKQSEKNKIRHFCNENKDAN